MMAQSYPLHCFVEYPPAPQPPTQKNTPLACGIPPVVYPPPPKMQAYEIYHSPPRPPPPPLKKRKRKKREKREQMPSAALKRKQAPSSASLMTAASVQSKMYNNGKLDPDLIKGVCRRSTGKWQAQLYWGGKDRYIGTFGSQEDAALACAIVQNELSSDGSPIDPNTTTRQLNVAREKAIEAIQDLPPAKKAKLVVESQKPVVKSKRTSTREKSPPSKLETERVEEDKISRKTRKSAKKKEVAVGEPKKTSKRGDSKKKESNSNDSDFDADVSRGITIRPSNRWQAQIYFQGKSRYIGVFDSRQAAGHAFVLTRTLLKPNGQTRMENQEASDTFIKARDKALNAVRSDPKYRVRHD